MTTAPIRSVSPGLFRSPTPALDVSKPYSKRVDAVKQLLDMQIAYLVKMGEYYQDPDNVKDMEEFTKSFTRGFVSVAKAKDKGSAFVDVVKRAVEETE